MLLTDKMLIVNNIVFSAYNLYGIATFFLDQNNPSGTLKDTQERNKIVQKEENEYDSDHPHIASVKPKRN